MKTIKFAFGTGTRKTLPFEIGGVTFFSRPLTSREELDLADLGDRYDLESADGAISVYLDEQAEALSKMLSSRAVNDPVDAAWIKQHLGVQNMTLLMGFLRTGERPDGTLDLTTWTDEPITIEGRPFTLRAPSFAEQGRLAQLPQDGTNRDIAIFSATQLSLLLDARALPADKPHPPVTTDWLLDHLGTNELSEILTLIQNGPNADGAEAEDPPSEAAASTPS